MTGDECGPDAHVHLIHGPALFALAANQAIMIEHRVALVAFHPVIAQRVADLINLYGLLDVPDSMPATSSTVWPPPCPNTRVPGPGSC